MKTLIINLVFLIFVFNINPLFCQVAINASGNPPVSSAALDVDFSNKGVIFPRVALTSATDNTTVASPVNGLLVYNTAVSGSGQSAVYPGYYYWYNNRWNRLQTSAYAGAIFGQLANSPNHFATLPPNFGYVGAYIDLPPGKWIVYTFLLLAPNNGSSANWDGTGFDRALWGTFTLSESNSSFSVSSDIIGSPLISGAVVAPSKFGMTSGAIYLRNSTTNVKRYYLWGRITQFNTSCTLFDLASTYWGENQFFAIPAE